MSCRTKTYLDLYAPAQSTPDQRAALIGEFYRAQLKQILSELVPKWEARLGVRARSYKVQAVRTKWGSCNPDTGNLLFNLELAKKPFECIEYVVLHELLHLLERTHNEVFRAHLDRWMPNWRGVREALNG